MINGLKPKALLVGTLVVSILSSGCGVKKERYRHSCILIYGKALDDKFL